MRSVGTLHGSRLPIDLRVRTLCVASFDQLGFGQASAFICGSVEHLSHDFRWPGPRFVQRRCTGVRAAPNGIDENETGESSARPRTRQELRRTATQVTGWDH